MTTSEEEERLRAEQNEARAWAAEEGERRCITLLAAGGIEEMYDDYEHSEPTR